MINDPNGANHSDNAMNTGADRNTTGKQAEQQKRYTLLYVEDNFANLRLVEEMIRTGTNYSIITTKDPEEGLRLAEQQLPDVILLDINLPGMSGYEVIDKLRNSPATRNIPVIAVTASVMDDDIKRSQQAGFRAHISKPIDRASFFAAIRECLSA